MEPPSLSTELRKLLLWLTLACFSRKFVQKQIDWTSRIDSFSQKRSKWAWFCPKVGVASKISRALRAQLYYWNPPSGNPGSATASYTDHNNYNNIIIIKGEDDLNGPSLIGTIDADDAPIGQSQPLPFPNGNWDPETG